MAFKKQKPSFKKTTGLKKVGKVKKHSELPAVKHPKSPKPVWKHPPVKHTAGRKKVLLDEDLPPQVDYEQIDTSKSPPPKEGSNTKLKFPIDKQPEAVPPRITPVPF